MTVWFTTYHCPLITIFTRLRGQIYKLYQSSDVCCVPTRQGLQSMISTVFNNILIFRTLQMLSSQYRAYMYPLSLHVNLFMGGSAPLLWIK